MKAASLLAENGIKTVSGKSTSTTKGCVYTLEILSQYENAIAILNRKGVIFSRNGGDN